MSDSSIPNRAPHVLVLSRSVAPDHGPTGLGQHVHDLVLQLVQRHVHVTLVTPPPHGHAYLDTEGGGLTVKRVGAAVPHRAPSSWTTCFDRHIASQWFGYRAGADAARLVAAGGVDVVHAFDQAGLGYARARLTTPSLTAPLIVDPWMLDASVQRHTRRRWHWDETLFTFGLRVSTQAADRVIAADRTCADTIIRTLGVAPGRVHTVPRAVDLDVCARLAGPADGQRARTLLGDRSGLPVLLSVGTLDAEAGVDVLLAACATLRDRAWTWIVIGDGPRRHVLESQVAEAGLAGRVRFAGVVSDHERHAWYEAASVVVHPVLAPDGVGTVLDAMAHRRPVITTEAAGVAARLVSPETGWRIPPADPAGLAAALRTALTSPGLSAMGQHGYAVVARDYSWRNTTDQLLTLYEEVRSTPTGTHGCPSHDQTRDTACG